MSENWAPQGGGSSWGLARSGDPLFLERGTLLFHPRHGSRAGREGSLAQKTSPELPGARPQDLSPLPLSPGLWRWTCWSSLLLLTALSCQNCSGQRAPWGLRR